MGVNVVEKPKFERDQIIPASVAGKRFGDVRKKAKIVPQFISEHNEIDTVVLNYGEYEKCIWNCSTYVNRLSTIG